MSGPLRGIFVAQRRLDRLVGLLLIFKTAGGSGEPKGNGAASRFPFPLPKSIIAKKKRKLSAYDLILGRIAARCSLTKQFLG